MKRSAACMLTLLSCVLLAPGISGQNRPDFSGTWRMVSPAQSSGSSLTVTQTATTLELTYSPIGGDAVSYNLDGTATRRTIRQPGGENATMIARASRKKDVLVLEETSSVGGWVRRWRMVLSMDAKGGLVLTDESPILNFGSDDPSRDAPVPGKFRFVRQ